MAELAVEGPDARELLSHLAVNSFEGFVVDRAKHFVPCTPDGYVIGDVILYGPLHVNNLDEDLDQVEVLLKRDYSDRFLPQFRPDYAARSTQASRPILSPERSLGSVIKLFTPSPAEFTRCRPA